MLERDIKELRRAVLLAGAWMIANLIGGVAVGLVILWSRGKL